jgi:DNA-binding CsgD family transcriptional regulator
MAATKSILPGHTWPLAGREAQMTEIAAALAPDGARSVVLAGAPGTGKSRLLAETLLRVRQTAGAVDCVVATRAAASVPFGVLLSLLPAVPRPAAELLELWRYAAGQLAARASGDRFILGVDDAHLLDQQSAALIHQLVLRGLVSAVMTVRAGEPAPDAVTALWKDGLARRLVVRPLPSGAVDAVLGHVLGPDVDGRTRQHIQRATGGNPLLLRELLTGALEEAALVQSFGVWHWAKGPRYGTGLIELVEGRLAELGEATRAAVEVVACAEPVAVAIVDGLADSGALQSSAVAEAERRGFIARQRSGRCEALLIACPVQGEVIRATLPTARTRQIMRWLVEAAQARPLRGRDDRLRLAGWQLAAGARPGRPALMAAAGEATLRGDLVLAERLVRAARDAAPDSRGVLAARHALARILTWQGRHREATVALPATPPAAGEHAAAAWAVTRAWNRYWGMGQHSEAIAELGRIEPRSPRAQAEIAGAREWLLLYSGQCRRAVDVCADAAGNAGLTWPFPLAAAAQANALAGRTAIALSLSERGLGVAGAAHGGTWGRAMLGWSYCLALLLSGHTASAQAVAEDGYAAAGQFTDGNMMAVWAACRGKVARAQGRLTAAQGAYREAVALLDEWDSHQFSHYVLAELAGIFALAGDAPAAREWMRRSDARRTSANLMLEPWAELARAWVTAAGGELALAARQARHAASLARASGQHTVEAEALYDTVRLGHPTEAPRLQELADTLDGALVPALAAAAAAFGAQDGYQLDEAAATFGALGLRLHAAEAAGAAARSHCTQGRAALANAAHQRLATFLDACPEARTPLLRIDATKTGTALTRREREIALMASSELPSRAIAAKLNLSVRTVSNHLGHIYAKLGVADRHELTARLDPPPRASTCGYPSRPLTWSLLLNKQPPS